MILGIFLLIVFGLIGAAIASSKKRNVFGWAILCAILPLIGIIILVFMPTLEDENTAIIRKQLEIKQLQALQSELNDGSAKDMVECPRCA